MFSVNKIFVFASMVMALTACKKDNGQNNMADKPQDISVIELKSEDIPLNFEFSARAQGSKETEVRAQVSGILLKRNYVEGSRVEEGCVLFQIDPKPYEVALDQAKAKLAQAQAQYTNAKTQWQRTEELFKEGFASAKSRDEALATMESLGASVQLAQAEVDKAKLDLDYTTVTAPISGVTSMEAQSEGSLISNSGEASLLTKIVQLDPIYVIFSLSENELMSFNMMREKGLIKNPENKDEVVAKIKFGNDSVYEHNGTINFINPTIDENTGTVKLRAVFPNLDGKIRPGQFLRLNMSGLTRLNAVSLPKETIMQEATGSYVYRVNANNEIETVKIKTGLTTQDGKWIVDEGLNVGDKIVANSLLKLRPGMKVNPIIPNN